MTKPGRPDKTGSSAASSHPNLASPSAHAARGAGASPAVGELRETGTRIGRYVVLERVGSGAMGVVYGAYDPELDRKIALKLLQKPKAGAQKTNASARLLREAKAMARLAHPNVVAVHDVGLVDEQVFLAMEFLAGGTLRGWLRAQQRSWRQILDVFIAAGRGLAAAHAAGLVHRDFKPENVLLDKDARPRVVDFGLARDSDSSDDDSSDGDGDGSDSAPGPNNVETLPAGEVLAAAAASRTGGGGHLETLTRTGALMGTPAYMAPEQFLGERADERTDQFSFCVALYEALYGERPFSGDDLISLSVSVTEGTLRALPKDRGVPAWVRRALMRGLRPNPGDRFQSMAWLIGALEDDPAIKRRRRLIAAGVVGAILTSLLVARQMVLRRRQEVERQIISRLSEATESDQAARALLGKVRALRGKALGAFDAMDNARGEALWAESWAAVPSLSAAYEKTEQALEAALVLDPGRPEPRRQMGDVLLAHLLWMEELRTGGDASSISARLAPSDPDGSRRATLAAPGTLRLTVKPSNARVALERYDKDATTAQRRSTRVGVLETTEAGRSLPAGSYRLLIDGNGLASVAFPFEVTRGQTVNVALTVPPAAGVPADFTYVPAGTFWFGDADERLRKEFLGTVPLHARTTPAYLIARHETTFGEWIAYLNALPAAQRGARLPDVYTALRGSLRLRPAGEHAWQLTMQPTTSRYTAVSGTPIEYQGRDRRTRQDWSRFPVAGISPEDAVAYAGWVSSTGRVPGARLCTELEWERAARGADDRLFPHGDELRPDDANIDVTYGRVASAYGPDEVGAHPLSRSPFEIDDLAGNVFELVASSENPDEVVIRGGGYYFAAVNCRVTNRERVPASFRDMATGIRLCAPVSDPVSVPASSGGP